MSATQRLRSTALLAAASLAAACHSGSKVPTPLPQTSLPTGAALKPFDPAAPTRPWPQASVQLGNQVWYALGNLDAKFNPGGPGMLVGLVPSTGALQAIDLGGADEHQCLNPGALRADSGKLYAGCSGSYATGSGNGVAEVDPSGAGALKRFVPLLPGFAASSIAFGPGKIWVGDFASASLVSVDRTTFALVDGASKDHPPVALPCPAHDKVFPFVSAILAVGQDLFALCSSSEGYLVRLDATTGAQKGDRVLVGVGPIAIARAFSPTDDVRLAIANSVGGTLTLVTSTASSMTAAKDALAFNGASDLEDVQARDQFVYVVNSGGKTVIKVDLSGAAPKVVDEVNVNPAGEANSDPTRYEVLDDDTGVVCDNGLGRAVAVQFGLKH